MSFKVDLVWKNNFRDRVRTKVGQALTATCREFFRGMEGVGSITLTVFSPDSHRRVVGNRAILIAPDHLVDQKICRDGLSVYVKCDANAQLCYLNVEGISSGELRQIVTMGPLSRQVHQRSGGPADKKIETDGQPIGESQDAHGAGTTGDSQSGDSDTSRSTDDPHKELRSFWKKVLEAHTDDVMEGFLVLKNEQLTIYADTELGVAPNPTESTKFYFDSVRPFGESVGERKQKGWKLDVSALQAFVGGGSFPEKKLRRPRGAKKPNEVLSGVREPDAVLNELEELLKRIEIASSLQEEQSHLQTVQGVNEGTSKELDAQIATAERTLAELRGKREVLKQALKKNIVRLEEIGVRLAQNLVAEETIRRLQEMGILKGTATGEENTVVRLVAQGGKP